MALPLDADQRSQPCNPAGEPGVLGGEDHGAYVLVGAGRTRMALAHKGLDHEALPTRFTEIPKIEGGRVKTVPALRDGAHLVVDSWAIAQYLKQAYPERPSLFGGAGGEQVTRFV